jgi:NADPH:quinone reductase-like Zn-dependent oxidoreductase
VRAARCTTYGGVDAVVVEDVPEPITGPGSVVVAVHAAAINFPDLLILEDKYQVSVPLPFIPGSELAGVVESVADDVTSLEPGDRVFGATFVGAFGERVAVPASALTRIPDGVDFRAAAAFGVAHGTAYHALRSVARVQSDEWVVVLGAAGGVGLAAVELAKVLGARVLGAAAGAERLAVCTAHGADAVVDYRDEDLKVRVKEITGGGADVVVDPVGGPYAEAALRAMRWGGRFVCVGFASGEIPRIPLNLVLLKGVTVQGLEMRGFLEHSADDARRDREELLGLLADGRIAPHVSATYPLEDVQDALRAVADRRTTGKVLVEVVAAG